ncbi:MAG: hypothetical protein ACOX1P_10415 [Thermoguttaceae bacterium]
MPIVVACRCGRRFRAIDELAGKLVRCPACGEPLAIPSTDAPSPAAGGPPGLADFWQLEQALAESSPHELGGGNPQQFSTREHVARRAQPERLNRWLIAAMCVAGGVVVVALISIILSTLWSDSAGASHERPTGHTAAKTSPTTTPTQPAAEGAVAKTPQESKPAAAPQPPRAETKAAEVNPKPPASGARKQSVANAPLAGSTSAPQPRATSIKLSAATALPQTLPTGTAMGFSVDYEFVSGQPDASAEYFWVIKSAQGRTVKQGVHLDRRGTLQGFVLEFQPEHGPFQTGLEDAQGRRLTELVPLR